MISRKRTILQSVFAVAIAMALLGCSNLMGGGGSNGGEGDRPNITVSMSANVGAISGSRLEGSGYVIEPIADDSHYKSERQGLLSATPIATFTPRNFVLQIDTIALYREENGNYETAEIWETTQLPPGEIIPQHIDLAYADNFIRSVEIIGERWDGFMIQFLPGVGETNSIPMHSFVGVDLTGASQVDSATFQDSGGELKEVTDEYGLSGTDLRYFEFAGLQPLDVGFLSYIVMGSNFSDAGIQNPSGEMGTWELPGGTTTGNASAIFAPANGEIDFSTFTDPEIVFTWELENLLELYQTAGKGTPGNDSEYEFVLTLALDRPFPLSITIRENQGGGSGTAGAPGTVMSPWKGLVGSSYSSDSWNVMHWINPADSSFDRVIIVRKDGAYPASVSDGEVVYEGHKPAFVDPTPNPLDTFHYTVFAVSANGEYSEGVDFPHE